MTASACSASGRSPPDSTSRGVDIFTFTATLWQMRGGSWVFVTVPPDLSEAVHAIPRPPSPGFGSVKVNATIGGSRWSTSIFPESESRCYVLPVKRPIRTAEGVDVGDAVAVHLELAE